MNHQKYYAIPDRHVKYLTDGVLQERWFLLHRGKQIGTLYHIPQSKVDQLIRILNQETFLDKLGLTFSFLTRKKKSKFNLWKFIRFWRVNGIR